MADVVVEINDTSQVINVIVSDVVARGEAGSGAYVDAVTGEWTLG